MRGSAGAALGPSSLRGHYEPEIHAGNGGPDVAGTIILGPHSADQAASQRPRNLLEFRNMCFIITIRPIHSGIA